MNRRPPLRAAANSGRALPWATLALLLAGGAGVALSSLAPRAVADGAASAAAGTSAPASSPRLGGRRVQPVSVASVSKRDIQVSLSAIGNIAAAN